MTIGQALKSLRLHSGMTQTEMAAGLISESFYSRVERDLHDIDASLLVKLLTTHHFDVANFFAQVANQTDADPFFAIAGEITYAQNRKDVAKLDQITQKIENGGVNPPYGLS